MHHHTADHRKFRILTILDEFTRQSLAIEVNRRLNHEDVLDRLTDLFIRRGSPWENGYIESFNGKLRDEVLNVEIFDTLLEARVLIELWRREYNHVRPHSSLGYRPPAPEVILPNISTESTISLIEDRILRWNTI